MIGSVFYAKAHEELDLFQLLMQETSYEDLLDVSGMDRFDTIRILADLVHNGIIGVR